MNIHALMPRGEIYDAGKYVVIIIGLGKLLDMMFGPSSEIIVLSKYYAFNIILILLLAASIVIANNILIPEYGINGAAIGSALALILFNVLKYIFIYIKLKMQPLSWATIKVLAIVGIAVGCNYLIPQMEFIFVDLVVRSVAITLVYTSLVFISKASPDGNQVFKKVLVFVGITKS
ncbi:MAG: polysaccharide biosynthesis C-terminal domain-containing protein [Cyclobacteriaceae bacterium]|nr:polysaccharide biosynthesis C-terminal domain-containing protein [Cyclobacteriaceae bacterium]